MRDLGPLRLARIPSSRDIGKFRVHRAGTKGGNANAGPMQLRAQRFGKTRDVGFARRVNGNAGIGRKPADELTLRIAPRLRAIICGSTHRVSNVNATILTCIISLRRVGSLVAKRPVSPRPALLINRSIAMFSCVIHSQNASTCA